jgi:hypothetical protein
MAVCLLSFREGLAAAVRKTIPFLSRDGDAQKVMHDL